MALLTLFDYIQRGHNPLARRAIPPAAPPLPSTEPGSCSGPCCGCWRAPTALMCGMWWMKSADAGRNCMSPAGLPTTKLSSLLSFYWLRPNAEDQGLPWL